MKKLRVILPIVFGFLVVLFFVLSVVDTIETRHKTNFSRDNIMTHIEKLSENGPRSIADKEENQMAIDYIKSELQSYGLVEEDTTDSPAYIVQDYVARDSRYQNWYLDNVIAHIPANGDNKTNEAIMFMAHFDSVPMGNGTSDDCVAISVMLEAVRYYLDKMEDGYKLNNDLVFCFVNGEEYGLYGSEAFMNEFTGFNNIVDRIKFGTNLESRGTSGTLIMFETAKNNYNTIKLFSKVNKNLFTCSVATMVYDMMPNSTDFTNFKEAYQGLNMANINGGEDYHTQNDNVENVGLTYMSQQAELVDRLIDKLSNYDLDKLYDADESAIFFSYLNITTVVYNHATVIVLAVLGILMLIANIVLSIFYRKQNNIKSTAIALAIIVVGLVLAALMAFICYYVFQWIAVMFGTIDSHMVGTITYSSTPIVIGIVILALAVTTIVSYLANKLFKLEYRALTRAFAYVHVFLGIVVSFALPDASYLFMISGLILMINELLITCIKNVEIDKYHGELLGTALYFPIIIPIIVLATSALGLTMAYVYGLVAALAIFNLGTFIAPLCKYFSIKALIQKIKKTEITSTPLEGGLYVLSIALIMFFVISCIKPNASVNLQGKQNIAKLPYDDALVYVLDKSGDYEYRIYDLNAYGALKKYSPDMEYNGSYYVGDGENMNIDYSIRTTFIHNGFDIKKVDEDSLIYLDFEEIRAKSFTISDGITTEVYEFNDSETYSIKIHSDCVVTINDGYATVHYREVIRDYEALIPEEYKNDDNQLHFNLWFSDYTKIAS